MVLEKGLAKSPWQSRQMITHGHISVLHRKVTAPSYHLKRGEEDQEFSGHETLFKVNGVPHKANEYQSKVNGIIPERTFKLLTNPFFFNQTMEWTERREILTGMAGEIDEKDITAAHPELVALLEQINGKTIHEYQKELAASKKLIKDEPVKIKLDGKNHYLCCNTCVDHYKEKYKKLKEGKS